MSGNTPSAARLAISPSANAYVRQFSAAESDVVGGRRRKRTTCSIFPETTGTLTGQQRRSFPRLDNRCNLSRELLEPQRLRDGQGSAPSGPKPRQQGQSFPRSRDESNMLSKQEEKEGTCCQLTEPGRAKHLAGGVVLGTIGLRIMCVMSTRRWHANRGISPRSIPSPLPRSPPARSPAAFTPAASGLRLTDASPQARLTSS